MAKYRKKPVTIEAFRLGIDHAPNWFISQMTNGKIIPIEIDNKIACEIKTFEGWMHGNYGDYIIKGIKGEYYPCKADIFEKTYELVE
ncbi:MAG: hypothetical protein ACFFDF_08710 [Candidatus Odinarchaeota archaeon]